MTDLPEYSNLVVFLPHFSCCHLHPIIISGHTEVQLTFNSGHIIRRINMKHVFLLTVGVRTNLKKAVWESLINSDYGDIGQCLPFV